MEGMEKDSVSSIEIESCYIISDYPISPAGMLLLLRFKSDSDAL